MYPPPPHHPPHPPKQNNNNNNNSNHSITIVSNFSWVLQSSQDKSKTMVKMQNLAGGGGGAKKKTLNGVCENGELKSK